MALTYDRVTCNYDSHGFDEIARHNEATMIVRDYLEPQRLGLDMNAPCPLHGWPTTVVSAHASQAFYEEHETALTLKTVFRGREVNEVGKARFALEPRHYLILNEGRRYAHAIENETEVLTLVFRPGMAQAVRKSLTETCDALLDQPHDPGLDYPFFERLYPNDDTLERHLISLHAHVARANLDESQLEEASYVVLSRLFEIHADILRMVDELPAVRYATKVELYLAAALGARLPRCELPGAHHADRRRLCRRPLPASPAAQLQEGVWHHPPQVFARETPGGGQEAALRHGDARDRGVLRGRLRKPGVVQQPVQEEHGSVAVRVPGAVATLKNSNFQEAPTARRA